MTSTAVKAESITLRILATSDVHGHFTGFNYFSQRPEINGLVHTATLIEQERASADISLLIENGDLIQGSPFTDYMVAAASSQNPLPLANLLNSIGYDAVNLGNHEFNYGLEYLSQAYAGVSAPILSANLHATSSFAKQHLTHKPYVIIRKEVANTAASTTVINIGLVGVLPPQIMQWDAHHLTNHVRVEPMYDAAQRAVKAVRDAGADIVILVAHTGMPKQSSDGKDSEQGVWELAQLAGIDGIIFGHQHEVFPGTEVYDGLDQVDSKQGTVFGIPAVQPGVHAEHLGILDFTLNYSKERQGWVVLSKAARVERVTAARNEALVDQLEPAHQATVAFMQQPIGHTQTTLSQQFARIEPTLAMQLIHDAQLWYIERYALANALPWTELPRLSAVAPFHAALSASDDFTSIEGGAVTLGDIGDLYRYPNTLDVLVVTGKTLKVWLEDAASALQLGSADDRWSWIKTDIPSYQFDTFSGIDYQINPSQPIGQRVETSPEINDEQKYAVVTNNYRANGGGDIADLDGSQIIYSSPDQIQHILIEYLRFLGDKGYPATLRQNWKIDKN